MKARPAIIIGERTAPRDLPPQAAEPAPLQRSAGSLGDAAAGLRLPLARGAAAAR
jgi:hypothetical protein